MTDRYKGFVVHLDKDMREDDCEEILTALRMIKHVADVKPLIYESPDGIAYQRGKTEIIHKLTDFIEDLYKNS